MGTGAKGREMAGQLTLLDVLARSPWLTALVVYAAIRSVFLAWNRLLRHLNIKAHGWPPAHCDADGDFRDEKDEQ